MNIWEAILAALEGIRTNKLRSILTMLGIVIGIAAVIAVVAIGQGGQVLLTAEFEKFGDSKLFGIYVDPMSDDPPTANDFAKDDMDVIKDLVPAIKGMSPTMDNMALVKSAKKNKNANVQGTGGDNAMMQNMQFIKGRYFTDADTRNERKVIVLEDKLAEDLFGKKDPLGQRVTLKNTQFSVIGVTKSKDSVLMNMVGGLSAAYIPYTVSKQVFNQDTIFGYSGLTHSGEDVNVAMNQAVKILERKHDNKGRYLTVTLQQQLEAVNRITGIMTLIVGAIAGISLFVGGIGVMNIMLVSVTERTREIGIRMALGAKSKDIMVQFLIEALVICTIGGVIGTAIGIGGAFVIAHFAKWPPLVSWTTVLVAFLFSSAVGIFFGLYPASKAAKLDPIEALRYE